LTEHLATLDTTATNFAGLSQAVARVCELLPPRPPKLDSAARAALCDSLTVAVAGADSTDSTFAALMHHKRGACGELPPPPRGPKPPRLDSLHADSTRPDSLRPPKPPRPDSTRGDSTGHKPPPPKGKRPHK
ncbi:MAG TPA: hypothetical protein VHO02_03395, partial [Fibrobacteria bacterium]|nr:hypothetical protein [Fibrobacteria bacterium]